MPVSPLSDLPETPEGWASLWTAEFTAAKQNLKAWHERALAIVKRYKGEGESTDKGGPRLNLFHADVDMMAALLLSKPPQVDVSRRFADSDDDVARVSSEMQERLLNSDIEKDSDSAEDAYKQALQDHQTAGLGNARLRYEPGEPGEPIPGKPAMLGPDGTEQAPAVEPIETRPNEYVHVDYVFWKDQLWSPARTFSELRWWAFANDMGEKEFTARFPGGEFKPSEERKRDSEDKYKDPMARCRVWEIWSKERKWVYWFIEGQTETLDSKEDPLDLDSFWPFPQPMFANLTTSELIPTPDFALAQDLYNGIDRLYARIDALEAACRVVGAYDKTNESLKRMLQGRENEMIPVENWAMFAEKGGTDGAVSWFPIEQVVKAIEVLSTKLSEKIALLHEVTGYSDIMRGQSDPRETLGAQQIKGRFASARVQNRQKELARFCGGVQKIKAEIIAKKFSPQTIINRSNIMRTQDAQFAQRAVELIQSPEFDFRVEIRADQIAMDDYVALQNEGDAAIKSTMEIFVGGLPLAQTFPPLALLLSEMAKWRLARTKGAATLEPSFDKFMAAVQQTVANPPPPQPNPQLEVAKVKADAEQFKAKADVAKTQLDMRVATAKHGMEMQKMVMDQHMQGQQMANDSTAMDMQQEAAQADHNRAMQSQAAKKATDK